MNTNIEKRSPTAGAERHALPNRMLGNVTTGLRKDSLNRLENVTVHMHVKCFFH